MQEQETSVAVQRQEISAGRHDVAAHQLCSEEVEADCVQHEGPAANSSGSASPLAMRIRSLREGASMSQARLAELVFVSRQTVINWEKGRTLPDAESLKRLSAAFGITLDALLDDRSEEYLRQTERERKTIWVAIVLHCMWFAWQPIDLFVNVLAFKYLDWDRSYAISNVVDAVDWLLLLVSSVGFFKVNRIKADHGLESVLDVAAFLEGYQPGAALPQTFVWRWLLPHWKQVEWAFVLVFFVVTIAPMIALMLA